MKLDEIVRRRPSWMLAVAQTVARDRMYDVKDAVFRTEFSRHHAAVRPFTACGNVRLRSLYRAVRHTVTAGIPGDLVECGCARGGSAALMGLTLASLGEHRDLWLFDTFEGLPPPSEADPDRDIANLYTGEFRGEYEEVRALFERLGIFNGTHMVKGLFQDTLPRTEVEAISVLHLDGDWYDSILVCLDHLYDRVSPGGVIQFDDYGHWEGARKAVDEFVARRSVREPLKRVDYAARILVKS